ncbi:exosortase A [Nitrosovibrio tenuis]|uniref:Exosortase A n=1 Tax=Nitrosovibrio tenuis TaxID=1233 RepID=A0A1H7FW30_9PROT|nr:exosortase A [Nitrosovibrio tenuis]SEK30283.1 exosortase A [Nitrosovibrio tenuis]
MDIQTPQKLTHDPVITLDQHGFKIAVAVTLVTIVAILASYHKTTWSMVSIWARSDTFAHGFLIFPFSAYLIWTQRKRLSALSLQPNLFGLAALATIGFSWLLAILASVQVFEQIFLVAMIPAAVWAILGNRMVWALAFPLAYLLLAVPFGEALISPLIDFTADFTVAALQLTGIPVYREGSFFTIPSGNWSVVEACSGLRYLIASFTLGTLYAYLTYQSLKRRLIFIALSVIVPLVANGIRAYMIVMTGHLSDMRLAVGIDHLIYGWVFFGFVMLLLFWIGSFWREDEPKSAGPMTHFEPESDPTPGGVPLKSLIYAATAVVAVALIWPAYAAYLENMLSRSDTMPKLEIAGLSQKWEISPRGGSEWRPQYIGATTQLLQHYNDSKRPERAVDLYITYYRNQQQGKELVNSENVLTLENESENESQSNPETRSHWRNVKHDTRTVSFGSGEGVINQNLIQSSSSKLLVWRWYWLGEEKTANPYLAKLILARNKLMGRADDGAEIIVAASYDDVSDEAAPILESFFADMMPSIETSLRNAGNR